MKQYYIIESFLLSSRNEGEKYQSCDKPDWKDNAKKTGQFCLLEVKELTTVGTRVAEAEDTTVRAWHDRYGEPTIGKLMSCTVEEPITGVTVTEE